MENTIYNTDNKAFRDVFISILAAIAVIYYGVAKSLGSPKGLRFYDWLILSVLSLASVYFIGKAIKRSQAAAQEPGSI